MQIIQIKVLEKNLKFKIYKSKEKKSHLLDNRLDTI